MLGRPEIKQFKKTEKECKRIVCDVCGRNHDTESCVFISSHSCMVEDAPTPSHARLTLPNSLEIQDLADGTSTVVAKTRLTRGTRFGPFVAPLTSILPPEVNFPFKIFGKSEEDSYYLDTRNEDDCNWMCLVAPAKTQNLFCYQVHDKLFFSLVRDIEPGEELRVWYAPFYGVKMGDTSVKLECPNSVTASEDLEVEENFMVKFEELETWEADTTTADHSSNEEDYIESSKSRQDSLRPRNKGQKEDKNEIQLQIEMEEKAKTAYVAQQLHPKRLGARFTPACWRCRECGAREASVIKYAHHLMSHLRPNARAKNVPCSLCHKKFYTQELLEEHESSRHGLSGLLPPIPAPVPSIEASTDPDDPMPLQEQPEVKDHMRTVLLDEHKSSQPDLSGLPPAIRCSVPKTDMLVDPDDPMPLQEQPPQEKEHARMTDLSLCSYKEPYTKEGKNSDSEVLANRLCVQQSDDLESVMKDTAMSHNSVLNDSMKIDDDSTLSDCSNLLQSTRHDDIVRECTLLKPTEQTQETQQSTGSEIGRKLVAVMSESGLQNLVIPIQQEKNVDSLLQSIQQPSHEKPLARPAHVPETILNHEFFTRVAGDTVVRDVKSLLSLGYSLQFLVENEDGSSSLVDVLSTGNGTSSDPVTLTSNSLQDGQVTSQQLVIMADGSVSESLPLALQNILPPSVSIVPTVVDPVVTSETSLLPNTSAESGVHDNSNLLNGAHLPACLDSDGSFLSKQNSNDGEGSSLETLLPTAMETNMCYDSVIPYTDSNSGNGSLIEMDLATHDLEREELDYELSALELPLAVDDVNSTDYIINTCTTPPNISKSNSLCIESSSNLNTPVKLLNHCIGGTLSADVMAFDFERVSEVPPASMLNSPQLEERNDIVRDGLTKDFSDLIAADADSSSVMLTIQPADSTAELRKAVGPTVNELNSEKCKDKSNTTLQWIEGEGFLLPAQLGTVKHVPETLVVDINGHPSVNDNFQQTGLSDNSALPLQGRSHQETRTLPVTAADLSAELDGLLEDASHSESVTSVGYQSHTKHKPQSQLHKNQIQSAPHTQPQIHFQFQSQTASQPGTPSQIQSQLQPQQQSQSQIHPQLQIAPQSETQLHSLAQPQTQLLQDHGEVNPQSPSRLQLQSWCPRTESLAQVQSHASVESKVPDEVQAQIQIQTQTLIQNQYPVQTYIPSTTSLSPHQSSQYQKHSESQSLSQVQVEMPTSTETTVIAEEDEMEIGLSFISSGPPYTCDICNKSFGRTSYLYRHLRKHTGEFTCVACRAVFARKETLQLHECAAQPMRSSGTSNRLSCPFCQKRFAVQKQLRRHLTTHAASRRLRCLSCDIGFSTKESLEVHVQRCSGNSTPNNGQSSCSGQDTTQEMSQENLSSESNAQQSTQTLRCDLCRRVFLTNTSLLRHKVLQHKNNRLEDTCIHCGRVMTLASQERLEQHILFCSPAAGLQGGTADSAICPHCNEPFRHLVLYRQHVYHHTHPFACAHCNRAFSSLQDRGKHVCLDNLEQCPVCEHRFGTTVQLERHALTHGVPNHHCFECGRSFHQMDYFNQHRCFELSMKICRQPSRKGIDLDDPSSTTVSSTSTRNINEGQHAQSDELVMCEICGEVCKSKRSLKSHRLLHGERKIECGVCGKRFHRKDVLVEHMYVHEDAQLRCSICNKLLKSNKSLDAHMRRHSGHKKFSCQVCSKEFHQKGNLQKHMKRHEPRPEPVSCPHCRKQFEFPETLAKHILEHMEAPRFHCTLCDNSFAKEQTLQQHMKFHASGGHTCPACGHTLKYRNSLRRHVLKNHPELAIVKKTTKDVQPEPALNNTELLNSPEVLLTVSQLQLTTDGVQQLPISGDVSVEDSCMLEEGAVECSEDMVLYVLQEPLSCLPLQEPSA